MLRFGLCFTFLCCFSSDLVAENANPIADTFTKPKMKERQAARGNWEYNNGIATCSHDDELYKKFKDHGPILTYGSTYRDAVVETEFKGNDAPEKQRIVFTMDGDRGHVVRLIFSPAKPSRLLVWNEGDEKPTVIARDLPVLNENEWTPLRVETKGTLVSLRIGDDEFSYEHDAIARQKTNAKISFAFGNFSAKEFHLIPKD